MSLTTREKLSWRRAFPSRRADPNRPEAIIDGIFTTATDAADAAVADLEAAEATITAAEDAMVSVISGNPTFSVAAEGGGAIVTTIQLKDLAGDSLTSNQKVVRVWLSATALGVPAATAPDGTVSFTTGLRLKEVTTKVLHEVISNTSGVIEISVAESTAKSFYVCVEDSGSIASQVITFAGP